MRSLSTTLLGTVLALGLTSIAVPASADGPTTAARLASNSYAAGRTLTSDGQASAGQRGQQSVSLRSAAELAAKQRLPGMRCRVRVTPRKCNIFATYRSWLAYLKYVGKPNPNARWRPRQIQYLRTHPGVDRRVGPASIFRHPGKAAFRAQRVTRRDHRRKGIPAAAFAKGGGPNYCSTLTISRLIESTIFRKNLFTAYHKVKWCWDSNVVYQQDHGNWTEISVHDGLAIINEGEVSSYEGSLPTSSTWYSSQQWNICNCAFKIGEIGHWQPLWRVWAKPGGAYDWNAHW